MQAQKDVRSVVIHNMLRDLDVQLVSTNAQIVIDMVISVAFATRKNVFDQKRSLKSRSPTAHQLQIGSVCAQDSLCGQSEVLSSSKDSFCLLLHLQSTQFETKFPT